METKPPVKVSLVHLVLSVEHTKVDDRPAGSLLAVEALGVQRGAVKQLRILARADHTATADQSVSTTSCLCLPSKIEVVTYPRTNAPQLFPTIGSSDRLDQFIFPSAR